MVIPLRLWVIEIGVRVPIVAGMMGVGLGRLLLLLVANRRGWRRMGAGARVSVGLRRRRRRGSERGRRRRRRGVRPVGGHGSARSKP